VMNEIYVGEKYIKEVLLPNRNFDRVLSSLDGKVVGLGDNDLSDYPLFTEDDSD